MNYEPVAYLNDLNLIEIDFNFPISLQQTTSTAFTLNNSEGVSVTSVTTVVGKADKLLLSLSGLFPENATLTYTPPLPVLLPIPIPIPYIIGLGLVEPKVLSFTIPVRQTTAKPFVIDPLTVSNKPTVQDFIDTFGLQEAIFLTQMENGSATGVNEELLSRALEDAEFEFALLGAGTTQSPRRAILTIARKLLDNKCPRPDIQKAYSDLSSPQILESIGLDEIFYAGVEGCCKNSNFLSGNFLSGS